MKKTNIALVLLGEIRRRLASTFQVLKYLLYGQKEIVSSVEIYGDREFCEAVKEALLLLEKKEPSSFTLIDQYLNLIIQSGETLLSPSRWGIALSLEERETKDVSQTWLACLLWLQGETLSRLPESTEALIQRAKVSLLWNRGLEFYARLS